MKGKKTCSRILWKTQKEWDSHSYNKYNTYNLKIGILLDELKIRASGDSLILDLGCNCGCYLDELKKAGYRYLSGVDISENAIEYEKRTFDLTGIDLMIGCFEEVLPELVAKNRQHNIIYSMGATLEQVHPSFDIVRYICSLSKDYVILGISEWGHAYPRFWVYEFNSHGFAMVKCIRLIDGTKRFVDPLNEESLLVF